MSDPTPDGAHGVTVPAKAFFTAEQVRKIITNPNYRGVIRVKRAVGDRPRGAASDVEWEEFKGRHEALVDDDLWFRANRNLEEARSKQPVRTDRRKNKASRGLLQGLLVCGCCDCAMSPGLSTRTKKDGEAHLYYRCTQLVKGGRLSKCTTRQVSGDAIEAAVVALMT